MIKQFISILFLLLQAPLWAQNIQGVVLDAKTKAPLSGTNLWLKGTQRGTASNAQGSFTLYPPAQEGVYTLLASMLGYAEKEQSISLNGTDIHLDTLYLDAEASLIQNNLIITAQRSLNQSFSSSEAISVLKASDIPRIPPRAALRRA